MQLEDVLKRKFGYSSFREGQKEIINDLLAGENVFAILPTGGGKSLCYLLPGFLAEGATIIVSPLLSLMEDQVNQLKASGEKKVIALNGFLPFNEKRKALQNLHHFRFIYVSPEILQTHEVLLALMKIKVTYFVIDEAHCVSQWGHEFRTDYLKLSEIMTKLGNPSCLALTATASQEVQEDIIHQLNMNNCVRHVYSTNRENIAIKFEKVDSLSEKLEVTLEYVTKLKGPGIIYCPTRNLCETVTDFLKYNGISSVAYYHGGLENEDRILLQKQFIHNQLHIICATNAFGMGINKGNIRYVLHFHYPGRMESYVQEIGRAGRDGLKSIAILLYTDMDYQLPNKIISSELPEEKEVEAVLSFLLQKGDTLSSWSEVQKYVVEILGMTEVKWRFLKYQFESFGIGEAELVTQEKLLIMKQKIKELISSRMIYKKKLLNEVQQWLNMDECRRRGLLDYFGEVIVEHPDNCCDICGLQDMDYYIEDKQLSSVRREMDWEQELREIFHIRQ